MLVFCDSGMFIRKTTKCRPFPVLYVLLQARLPH